METARMFTSADLALLPDDGRRYEVIEGNLYASKLPSASLSADSCFVIFKIGPTGAGREWRS